MYKPNMKVLWANKTRATLLLALNDYGDILSKKMSKR